MKRVAFVIHRCGLDIRGGAERHCLDLALHMAAYWEVEILTTCARDYRTWRNHYPPGEERLKNLTLRRFPVDRERSMTRFEGFSAYAVRRVDRLSLAEQEEWLEEQGPVSSALHRYVCEHEQDYDAFIFFTYLYATSYFTLPWVAHKAYLAPTAHDEWPIYMSMWDDFFTRPQGFLFNSPAEERFLQRRFPQAKLPGSLVGAGVDPPSTLEAAAFRKSYGLEAPFLLYIGRIEPGKGCGELFSAFAHMQREYDSDYKLALIGPEAMDIPRRPDVIYLGVVDEVKKWNALAAAQWLVNPSPAESLSLVALEAWSVKTPVLATYASDVLVEHCRSSNGGMWWKNSREFSCIVHGVDASMRKKLAENGYQYTRRRYVWSQVAASLLALMGDRPGESARV